MQRNKPKEAIIIDGEYGIRITTNEQEATKLLQSFSRVSLMQIIKIKWKK